MLFCFCGQATVSISDIWIYTERRLASQIRLPWILTEESFLLGVFFSLSFKKGGFFESKCPVQIFLCSADLMSHYLSDPLK